jgi:hypothetical protein
MLYLRTAFGSFINTATIVALSPRCDDGSDAIAGWIATCTGGEAVELAAYYVEPGRLEQAIRLMPAVDIRLADHSAT